MRLFVNPLMLAAPLAALMVVAGAAQPTDKVLTLQDCLRLAEAAPSAVTIARQERRITDRDWIQARTGLLPQSEVLSNFSYNSPRLDDRSTFSFLPLNAIREYAMLGTVRQEFDISGRVRAEMSRARANQEIARINVEIAERDLRRAVTIAYYRLLLARRLVATVKEALEESRNFEQRARTLFEGGEAARADVVKASAQAAFLQQALGAAELEAGSANQELASFWMKDVTEPLAIADVFDEPLPAPESDAPSGSLAGNLGAYLKRPEFKLYAAEQRGFEADARRARSALLPQLSFVFQYGMDSDALRWRDRGHAAFANLRIPVFDWFRARSQQKQFKLRAEQVETNRAIAERTFSRDYQIALARVKRLFAQVSLTREQVRLAEEDLKLSRVRYDGGEGSALDVVAAQNQLAQARNNYYTSVANYMHARIDLEAASGK